MADKSEPIKVGEDSSLTYQIIAVLIAIVIVGAVLIPILNHIEETGLTIYDNSENATDPPIGVDVGTGEIYTDADTESYVSGDTVITAITNPTQVNADLSIGWNIEGTIDDGFEVTPYPIVADDSMTATLSSISITNKSIHYATVDSEEGLYKVTSFSCHYSLQYDLTKPGGGGHGGLGGDIICQNLIVPKEIVIVGEDALPSTTVTILNIIPIFLLIAILFAIVSVIYLKREEIH